MTSDKQRKDGDEGAEDDDRRAETPESADRKSAERQPPETADSAAGAAAAGDTGKARDAAANAGGETPEDRPRGASAPVTGQNAADGPNRSAGETAERASARSGDAGERPEDVAGHASVKGDDEAAEEPRGAVPAAESVDEPVGSGEETSGEPGDEPAGEVSAEDGREAPRGATGPASRGVTTLVAWAALAFSLVALAAAGFGIWRGPPTPVFDQAAGSEADDALDAVDAVDRRIDGLRDDSASLRADVSSLRDRLAELDTGRREQARLLSDIERRLEARRDLLESLPGRIENVEESLAGLQGISADARDNWLEAEAEYYLQIANAQLQLARNPELARYALELADQRVRELADPAYTPVRRALAEEIRSLEALGERDIEGASLRLGSLADAVAGLPLARDVLERPAEEDAGAGGQDSGTGRALGAVRDAFGNLVRVRRTDERVEPLLSPEAEYFLRTNVELQLQTARLALLRGETAAYRESLEDARAWLERYYATESPGVKAAIAAIDELAETELAMDLPDISRSLTLLRRQSRLDESRQ